MAKNKLRKFAEVATFTNVIQPDIKEVFRKDYPIRGNWHSQFFKNTNPIVLELGCGKGEYTTGLAARFPDKNFIGIDIKGARIWKGASEALEKGLANAGFLRTRIEHISSCFGPDEVSEIWITFPDPQEKRDRSTKRLTSSLFLPVYKKFLKPSGIIHLKTDNEILYKYTCRLCQFNNLEVNELPFFDWLAGCVKLLKTQHVAEWCKQRSANDTTRYRYRHFHNAIIIAILVAG